MRREPQLHFGHTLIRSGVESLLPEEVIGRLCAKCGKRAVKPLAIAGRTSPWRQFRALPVPAGLAIPTCSNCGSEWIDLDTAEQLDAALSSAADERLRTLAQESLAALKGTHSQQDLESLLGLSGGYLSKVKRAKDIPSDHLVVALMLLAAGPGNAEKVEQAWTTGHLPARVR